ncbi:TraE/TraK family type IV conjugative transfer system protein [Aquimonas voraii]|uniref:TraE protein n=1 Tax=Aquimonas voraii TaxID=265719 RepID=A0A1G6ZST3_9GAMM|nr:TraE/TraK family type IV conjugative transfer system protein [Aquimonas voraii]SDE05581.1 TraE protein [Aquimonas voraii]
MKLGTQRKTFEQALRENSLTRWIVAGQVLVVLVMAFGWASTDQRVVLVPPTLSTKAEVSANWASQSLQIAWGQFLATNFGNISPRNADVVLETVGSHLSPSVYRSVVDRLAEQIKVLKDEQLTIAFDPMNSRWDENRQSVLITGEHRIRGLRGAERREVKTYEMRFVVSNYRVLLDHLDVHDGATPPPPQKAQG